MSFAWSAFDTILYWNKRLMKTRVFDDWRLKPDGKNKHTNQNDMEWVGHFPCLGYLSHLSFDIASVAFDAF